MRIFRQGVSRPLDMFFEFHPWSGESFLQPLNETKTEHKTKLLRRITRKVTTAGTNFNELVGFTKQGPFLKLYCKCTVVSTKITGKFLKSVFNKK